MKHVVNANGRTRIRLYVDKKRYVKDEPPNTVEITYSDGRIVKLYADKIDGVGTYQMVRAKDPNTAPAIWVEVTSGVLTFTEEG